jgi:ring-1,2-phenylacetyl-CoA epoxidase subunit PaaC
MFHYLLQLADNALILGHRLSEWCGHGPILEQDMAMSNIALDLVGQARNLYQYAAELERQGRDEDDLAYLRDVYDFRNVLLVEQPNGDFAMTVARQFLYSTFNFYYQQALTQSVDERLAAIAAKALKEATYHLRWSSEWVIRLGDGTEESHRRMNTAFDALWAFRGEFFMPTSDEKALAAQGVAPDLALVQSLVDAKIKLILDEATLPQPADGWMQSGGKTGRHSEHLGYILAEMQYLQRAYPNSEW